MIEVIAIAVKTSSSLVFSHCMRSNEICTVRQYNAFSLPVSRSRQIGSQIVMKSKLPNVTSLLKISKSQTCRRRKQQWRSKWNKKLQSDEINTSLK
jgi:hypothetical protein